MIKTLIFLFFVSALILVVLGQDDQGIYNVGVGIGDITGPPAGVVLNGYVNPIALASGIFTRQFARTFMVESKTTGDAVVFVTCDMGMIDHSIKNQVILRLSEKYGDKFSHKNVMISATHTHSGVSGFMTYYAYLLIESYGFNPLTFWAAVDGITESIEKAVESLQDGKLYWNGGDILEANGNRQGNAYAANPDKDLYEYDTDKEMVLLKMETIEGDPIGAFNWWPVHPISFNGGFNILVSSDNKGYASTLMDAEFNVGKRPGQGRFVSGFASSNLGDVSPRHPDPEGKLHFNITEDLSNVKISGTIQFNKALELFNDVGNLNELKGPVRFVHTFMDVTNVEVETYNEFSGEKQTLKLCKPGLGYSFVGLEPEHQDLWEMLMNLLNVPLPSEEMIICHAPKLVALPAGEMDEPWPWAPSIVALQLFQIGTLDIVGTPGEYTTMAGRRVRNAVYNATNHKVVIAGLANNYINYIATPEEYDVTEYEGGATIFGRNTQPVTAALFKEMAEAMISGNGDSYPEGPDPPSFLDKLRPEVFPIVDEPVLGYNFGDVKTQPEASYTVGDEVSVIFIAGSPRHSSMRGGTFFTIEKKSQDMEEWTIVRTDADIDTFFWWNVGLRSVEVNWIIGPDVEPGVYRVNHYGFFLSNPEEPGKPYHGTSQEFSIV